MQKKTFRPAMGTRLFHGVVYGGLALIVLGRVLPVEQLLIRLRADSFETIGRLIFGLLLFGWAFSICFFNRVKLGEDDITIYHFFQKHQIPWRDAKKIMFDNRPIRRSGRTGRPARHATIGLKVKLNHEDRIIDLTYVVETSKMFGGIDYAKFLRTPFVHAIKRKKPGML